MSKSTGNYIGIDESPEEMFGKTMSIPDNLIISYFELVADVPLERLREIRGLMQDGKVNPRDLKLELGESLVRMYHGADLATAAREGFVRQFSQRQAPVEIESCIIVSSEPRMRLAEVVVKAGGAATMGEAKRKIEQSGVRINDTVLTDPHALVETTQTFLLNVGKRFYREIQFKG
jgi:tyrosyl-tRNA synthetase